MDSSSSSLPVPRRLDDDAFARLVRAAPLVAVDLIIRNREGKVLVARRSDEPAKGTWFNPGGIVLKGEPVEAAFERIMLRETGRHVPYAAARFRGYYQHLYKTTRFGSDPSGTHYVVLAHDVALDAGDEIVLDQTHSSYRWLSEAEILASADVHEYVKDYFRPTRRTRHAPL